MLGCHVYSAKPGLSRGLTFRSLLQPAEACTLVLGALQWRKLHGPMRLYADADFKAFIANLELEWLYNGGIDTATLDALPANIRYDTFWAAGKVFAYSAQPAPAAFMDVDLVLWRAIPDGPEDDLVVLHREFNGRGTGRDYTAPDGYRFPDYPWDGEEFNMGFVLFKDDALRREYAAQAIAFMTGNEAREPWKHMCFAEQYLLAQCAKRRRSRARTVLDHPPWDDSVVTHLWGAKQKFRDNPTRAKAWVTRGMVRMEAEFPGRLPQLRRFMDWASATAAERATNHATKGGAWGPELLRRPPRRVYIPHRSVAIQGARR